MRRSVHSVRHLRKNVTVWNGVFLVFAQFDKQLYGVVRCVPVPL